jgi:hypothetical protein
MSESNALKRLFNTAAAYNTWLFRNNVGGYTDSRGRFIRYGLCRGSADAIGWTEVTITQGDVGRTVAVFTAYETKSKRGPVRPDQEAFLRAVAASGGIAGIVRDGENINERLARAVAEWRKIHA